MYYCICCTRRWESKHPQPRFAYSLSLVCFWQTNEYVLPEIARIVHTHSKYALGRKGLFECVCAREPGNARGLYSLMRNAAASGCLRILINNQKQMRLPSGPLHLHLKSYNYLTQPPTLIPSHFPVWDLVGFSQSTIRQIWTLIGLNTRKEFIFCLIFTNFFFVQVGRKNFFLLIHLCFLLHYQAKKK